ncbi:hypothetical protein [Streptosporangium roseum]|uniref:hypothetical protein n=1 Tax=Streptosporangium roseum TaxID=2001 RepID=UPI0034471A78
MAAKEGKLVRPGWSPHELDHLDGRLSTSRMRDGLQLIPVEEYRGIGQPWIHGRRPAT